GFLTVDLDRLSPRRETAAKPQGNGNLSIVSRFDVQGKSSAAERVAECRLGAAGQRIVLVGGAGRGEAGFGAQPDRGFHVVKGACKRGCRRITGPLQILHLPVDEGRRRR